MVVFSFHYMQDYVHGDDDSDGDPNDHPAAGRDNDVVFRDAEEVANEVRIA